MEESYKHEYDNPYRMLAASIAVRLNLEEAKRVMSDTDYLRQLIQQEVRENIDIPGMFTDCIITELISTKQKVKYRTALNELGLFFFKQLDIARLRKELKKFYSEFGIDTTPDKK